MTILRHHQILLILVVDPFVTLLLGLNYQVVIRVDLRLRLCVELKPVVDILLAVVVVDVEQGQQFAFAHGHQPKEAKLDH